jgi:GNAT superfamily N-acetyltransferase
LATVRAMEEDGFRLAFIEQDAEVVAAAGYRIYSNLFMGKHCYVDDLVTAEAQRSKGFGQQMIDWLRAEAQVAGCKWFHLDSGTQRDQAHKFYFAQGFTIASYHFSEELAQ